MTFIEEPLIKPTIYKGFKEFYHGHRSQSNEFREDQQRAAMISGNIDAVQQLITLDHHVTCDENKAWLFNTF